jgi:hypothetical protein
MSVWFSIGTGGFFFRCREALRDDIAEMFGDGALGHPREIFSAAVCEKNDDRVVIAAEADVWNGNVIADNNIEILSLQFLGGIAQEFF